MECGHIPKHRESYTHPESKFKLFETTGLLLEFAFMGGISGGMFPATFTQPVSLNTIIPSVGSLRPPHSHSQWIMQRGDKSDKGAPAAAADGDGGGGGGGGNLAGHHHHQS